MSTGWIGVDFDGTLVTHNFPDIGDPVPLMVSKVKDWHAKGIEVRVVTARATEPYQIPIVQAWCRDNLGFIPRVTCSKDYSMICLYDDRAVQIIPDTGKRADGKDKDFI